MRHTISKNKTPQCAAITAHVSFPSIQSADWLGKSKCEVSLFVCLFKY